MAAAKKHKLPHPNPAKPAPNVVRFGRKVWASLDAKIIEVKAALNAEDKDLVGHTNREVVAHVVDFAATLFSGSVNEMIADIVAKRVSLVLGGGQTDTLRFIDEPIMPELGLASHFSVPQLDHSAPRWKRQLDCTPNELQRVVAQNAKFIDGVQATNTKIRVLVRTALGRGCDPDQPVKTVIQPDDPAAKLAD